MNQVFDLSRNIRNGRPDPVFSDVLELMTVKARGYFFRGCVDTGVDLSGGPFCARNFLRHGSNEQGDRGNKYD